VKHIKLPWLLGEGARFMGEDIEPPGLSGEGTKQKKLLDDIQIIKSLLLGESTI